MKAKEKRDPETFFEMQGSGGQSIISIDVIGAGLVWLRVWHNRDPIVDRQVTVTMLAEELAKLYGKK